MVSIPGRQQIITLALKPLRRSAWRRRSLSSVVIKSIDREKVRQAIESYVARLRHEHPEVQRVIWFGSWVNGLPTPPSDVDLCLIVSATEKPPRDRISDYLPFGFPTGIDLFVYTEDELERLKSASPGWYAAIAAGVEV
jgi:predicted nucleotidyltransferase